MSILRPEVPSEIDSRFAGLVDANESGWFLNDTNEYFRGFSISPEDTVLDVGCGKGTACVFSAERGARVIFTDILPSVVEEVGKKLESIAGAGEFQGLVCDSDPLTLPSNTATRIVCSEVLEHVDSPERVMKELERVGKPGALYLLTVPGEMGERIQEHFAPPEYFAKPNHVRILSKTDFIRLIEDSGLIIESYSETGFFWVMWMSIHWAVEAATNQPPGPVATLSKIEPPFDESLDRWASLWVKLISTPEGLAFKHQMDKLLPKNQVVVARKSG